MVQIRECTGREDTEFFWARLKEYFEQDMFPDPQDEDREYFLGADYRTGADRLHAQAKDPLRYLLFERGGEKIGFVMATVYESEGGRCFLMEFCVLPPFRGNGTGRACAKAFEQWAKAEGAEYIELNAHTEQRKRFWRSVGYQDNGRDDWGDPALMLPPEKKTGLSARQLRRFDDWQLTKLVNSLRCEAGHEPLTDEQKNRMAEMLRARQYRACILQRGWRWIGIAFADGSGEIAGMYVEPVFRSDAAEEMLLRTVRQMG